ncbi:diaminohydroxyphosphoribosylaminopyrimidine deaminase/5-amino-6-(5-phosphoribosylamino)uracil reductase [Dokdonella fugitiva]|uniref:Riboflavin biosynthesis protein RibD n=2 Tax=Dokdonella fugitiva TaxID=328517 RepID=A0A4R2IET1_9GAMM|nr:diaminohydroxyphosphoribosylaminopyrimidine deaminase/5-amino-6-(5-phosphoribosylamino)uracil reductase [Dokdonella fugitiva]
MFAPHDHALMAHALRLAAHGLATTRPNPRVGCVIARGDAIVGEGWHRRAGEPHAEVLALQAAGADARGATAYVTLEPCGLHGRTPPCADALVDAGVARVVIAAEDAAQRGGGGLERLRAAGIAVETGLMRDAARELNRGFFARVERNRPWLRLKLAMSLDGRTALAGGESKWITGEAARTDVQRWRARSCALLTGSGTVLADDPRLTVRLDDAPADAVGPLRVVLDSDLRTPRGAHVLDGCAPTLVLHAPGMRARDDRFAAVELAALERAGSGLDLGAALALLAARGMNEVQVEAGPTLGGALFAAGLVDELLLYVAPVLLGDDARALLALPPLACMADRARLRVHEQRMVGDDIRLLLRPAAD